MADEGWNGTERRRGGLLGHAERGLHRLVWLTIGERVPYRNRYRDVMLGIALIFVAASIWAAYNANQSATHATREADNALVRVQQGRATSIGITCAALSAVSEAGREVITGNLTQGNTPFTRALEKLGYPPLPQRRAQAHRAAAQYVQLISSKVDSELEERGRSPIPGLVRKDGTINCQVLESVARVPLPHAR